MDEKKATAAKTAKENFLVFLAEKRTYAVPSKAVQEILRAAKIYEMPFTPPLIRGVIHYRSEIFSVVSTPMVLSNSAVVEHAETTEVVIVLKREDDNISLSATEIKGFAEAELKELPPEQSDTLLLGEISFDTEKAFVLNIDEIENCMRNELGYK